MSTLHPRAFRRTFTAGLLALGLAAAGAVAFPLSASASTLTVTSNADTGVGTLRDLVATSVAGDTIVIPASITSIQLETEIDINHSLSIEGPGASLVIDRGAASGINLFEIGPGTDVTISGMTITASGSDFGVAIGSSVAHNVTIDNVTVENQSYSGGSAVYLYQTTGDVTISDSTFANNVGTATQDGGAIRIENAANLTITGSTFSGNHAGGAGAIYVVNLAGALTIDSSTFEDNHALGPANAPGAVADGGALYIDGIFLDSTISNSTFTLNSSAAFGGGVSIGAVHNARLTISASTFGDNSGLNGGGLAVGQLDGAASNGLLVEDSTFYDNSSVDNGSSIYLGTVDAPLTLQNTTVNDSAIGLGALYVDDLASSLLTDALSVLSSTIYGPGGVVVGTFSSGLALVDHSILFSTNGAPALDIVNPGQLLVDLNRDLLSTASDPAVSNNAAGTSQFGIADMKLGALTNNGGSTLTRLPADNSPAHNGGDPTYAGPSPFDQRGSGFARKIQAIDIGAVELQTLSLTPSLAATGFVLNPWVPVSGVVLLLLGVGAVLYTRKRRESSHRA
ncbi:MAG: Hemolysin-type calcium-binding region [Rhodoglobus sp.]|nr:Hemolysin-type calcium-binding region [Rhodoglobus sp.]